MKYLPQVTKAKYVKDYVIFTKFDDGTEKNIDISQWVKGLVFDSLKNVKTFKKFFIEAGMLAWSSGVDIAAEALYLAKDYLSETKKN